MYLLQMASPEQKTLAEVFNDTENEDDDSDESSSDDSDDNSDDNSDEDTENEISDEDTENEISDEDTKKEISVEDTEKEISDEVMWYILKIIELLFPSFIYLKIQDLFDSYFMEFGIFQISSNFCSQVSYI